MSMDGPTRNLLPRSRRLTTDLMRFAKQVPHCTHSRMVKLGEVMEARKDLPERVSLAAIFVKAFGLMAQRSTAFRQLFIRWPLESIYQHDKTVLMMAIAREFRDEPWVFWGRFTAPESRSLSEIQEQLTRYQTGNVKRVFRQQYQLSAFPALLRRAIWWWNLNVSGRNRARRTGTAFLSTLASHGVEIDNILSVQTGCFTYGPMNESGQSRVTICYDHRVMDGATVAQALEELAVILSSEILDELRLLNSTASPRAA